MAKNRKGSYFYIKIAYISKYNHYCILEMYYQPTKKKINTKSKEYQDE